MKGIGRTLKDIRIVSYFSKGKRWLILSFCMLLALVIWLFQTLNGTYTKVIRMEVAPIELPAKYSIDNSVELPKAVTLEVTASGNKLLNFTITKQLFNRIPKLRLDVDTTLLDPQGGHWTATGPDIIRMVRNSYPQLDEIFKFNQDRLSVRPDYLGFYYAPMAEQVFPIVFNSQFDFGESTNRFLKSWEMDSEEVVAYGMKSKLDSLVSTNSVILTDSTCIKIDNVGRESHWVPLLAPDGITLSQDSVKVDLVVQDLKYYSYIQTDLSIRNLPDHVVIRLFPSSIKVTYLAEENVNQEEIKQSLRFFVDLKELDENNMAKKLKVNFDQMPKEVHMIQLEPDQVEYLLEEKGKAR